LEGDSALPLSHFDMPLIARRRSSAALQKIIFASCGSGFVNRPAPRPVKWNEACCKYDESTSDFSNQNNLHRPMISEPLLHRMKILIVDDERLNVVMLERWLQHNGYKRVRGVTDSRTALETYAAFDPDLILLDLIMPHVDGFAILEALRPDGPIETFLPVIVLTADISEEAKQHALEAGATDFLVKPFNQTEALLRIRNLLEIRRLHLLLDNQRAALEDAIRQRGADLQAR
jgi:PleD family two-component response regulator